MAERRHQRRSAGHGLMAAVDDAIEVEYHEAQGRLSDRSMPTDDRDGHPTKHLSGRLTAQYDRPDSRRPRPRASSRPIRRATAPAINE